MMCKHELLCTLSAKQFCLFVWNYNCRLDKGRHDENLLAHCSATMAHVGARYFRKQKQLRLCSNSCFKQGLDFTCIAFKHCEKNILAFQTLRNYYGYLNHTSYKLWIANGTFHTSPDGYVDKLRLTKQLRTQAVHLLREVNFLENVSSPCVLVSRN